MIFKTFDSELDGVINKMGVFNKSFYNIKRDLSNGQGIFSSLFSGNNITSKDVTAINAMAQSMKNGSTVAQAWRANMRGCTVAAKEQVKQCLKNKGSLTELSASMNSMTISAKAGAVALKGLAIAGNMIAFVAISKGIELLIDTINDYVHASEIAREKSSELTDAWTEENSSIEDSITKYKELRNKLQDTSLSSSEVKDIKEQLIAVQKDLVDKYGQEALNIDLVNGKYDEQIEKLDELSKKKAQDYVATNADNIKEDKEYLSKVISGDNTTDIARYQTNLGNDEEEKQYKEAEKTYKKYLKKYEALSLGYDYFKGTTGLRLNVKGTREEIQTQLSQLFSELNEDYKDNPPEFIQGLKDVITETLNMDDFDTTEIENAKNNIKAYTEAEILANSKTRNLYNDSVKAVEEYNNALASGKGVKAAKENLDDVQQKVSEAIKGYEGYDNVFNEIFDSIQKADDKIKEVKSDVDSSDVDTTITFKAVFNAEDFKDTKEELLELAKSGELTTYTLSSTKEYNTLLEQTGLTAEQAYKRIMKIAKSDMDLTDWQTSLENARKSVISLKEMKQSLNKDGISSVTDDVISNYPELMQYLEDEGQLREGINNLISDYENKANEAYFNLMQDSEAYYSNLKAKEADKLNTANKTINGIVNANKTLVDQLGGAYNVDLKNFKSIAQAKAQLEQQLIINSAEAWSKYYKVQLDASKNTATVVAGDSSKFKSGGTGGSDSIAAYEEASKAQNAANAAAKAYNEAIESLKSITSTSISANITSPSPTKGSGGSKNKNSFTKFAKTIDWCAETITNLTNKIGNLNAKLNNTDALQNQIKYYKQLINAQNGLVKGYEKTADRYQKVYNKALKKLSKADQNKVKNGAYTIEQFSGKAKSGKKSGAEKRYNNIQKAIEARDNVVSNSNNLIDAKAQLKEYAEGLASIRWDKASEKVD